VLRALLTGATAGQAARALRDVEELLEHLRTSRLVEE
jgi:hypothetical protein